MGSETEHVHKFNATILGNGKGRCSCGAWANWSRYEKRWGEPIQHAPTVKGLENRLARFKDPESKVFVDPERFVKAEPREKHEPAKDLVKVFGPVEDEKE